MMKWFSILLFVFWFWSCVSSQDDFDEDHFKEKFEKALHHYVKTGEATDFLEDVVDTVKGEGGMGRNNNQSWRNSVTCLACQITMDYFILKRRNGSTRENLAATAINICSLITFNRTPQVCRGLIKLNIDTILFIVDNRPKLNGEYVCSVVLQDRGCPGKHPEWSVKVPTGTSSYKSGEDTKSLKVLHITDIHYDPNYLPGGLGNCQAPLCCQNDDPISQNQADAAGFWGDYRNCDAPLHVVQDTLKQANQLYPEVDYIYFTGDIIAHRVWDTSRKGNTKDIQTILQTLREYFPAKPIYPILGNHEPHPLNVYSPTGIPKKLSTQWIYELVADEWSTWLPQETRHTILKGGYYTVLVKPGFRIIALNSNLGYVYNWWMLYDQTDPAGQLQWLAETLLKAEENGELVHILTHIPSGDPTCLKNWGREFRRVLERFSGTVRGIFNGHTHYDEFVVYFSKARPEIATNVAFNGGSITPYNDLNPNFRVYEVGDVSYEVVDYHQHIYNLTEANLDANNHPRWYQLYSFKAAYGVPNLKPSTMAELVDKMAQMRSYSNLYSRFKIKDADTSLAAGCNSDCVVENLCDTVTNEYRDKSKCHSVTELYVNNA